MSSNNIFSILHIDDDDDDDKKQKKIEKKVKKIIEKPKTNTNDNNLSQNNGEDFDTEKLPSKNLANKNLTGNKNDSKTPKVVTGRQPRREFDKKSGTGRGKEIKKSGGGGHNWGSSIDENLNVETVEQLKTDSTTFDLPKTETVTVDHPVPPTTEQNKTETPTVPVEPEEIKLSFSEYQKQQAELRSQWNSEAFGEVNERKVESKFDGLIIKKETVINENYEKKRKRIKIKIIIIISTKIIK